MFFLLSLKTSDLSLGDVLLFPIDDKESRGKGQDLVSKSLSHARTKAWLVIGTLDMPTASICSNMVAC